MFRNACSKFSGASLVHGLCWENGADSDVPNQTRVNARASHGLLGTNIVVRAKEGHGMGTHTFNSSTRRSSELVPGYRVKPWCSAHSVLGTHVVSFKPPFFALHIGVRTARVMTTSSGLFAWMASSPLAEPGVRCETSCLTLSMVVRACCGR